jgi:serine/threonine protein kinase
MAPEQIRGEDPTPATDIYALGVVLYEMLAGGERPFTGERARTTGSTAEKVRWEHLHLDPQPLHSLNPVLSPRLETVVEKCLEKDPLRRYASPLDLLEALESAVTVAGKVPVIPRKAINQREKRIEAVTLDSRPARRELQPTPTRAAVPLKQKPARRLRVPSWLSTLTAGCLLSWHYLSAFFGKI